MNSKRLIIYIGTDNPSKIKGAEQAFSTYFKDNFLIKNLKVASDTKEQPFNDEILEGAKNRVKNLKEELLQRGEKDVDFYIASEAGIIEIGGNYFNVNLALIEDSTGYQSFAISQGYMIPRNKIEEIKEKTLGKVLDEIFGGSELYRNKGGINLLTEDVVSRIDLVKNSFVFALIPYLKDNEKKWK